MSKLRSSKATPEFKKLVPDGESLWGTVFGWCVGLLVLLALKLDPIWPGGMSYMKINVLLFCILLPAVLVGSLGLNIFLLLK